MNDRIFATAKCIAALAVAAALATCARAGSVTPSMARQAAEAWAAGNPAFGAAAQVAGLLRECDTNAAGTVLWYQVSLKDPATGRTGCLMVSPATELEPVVAALDSDPGELPAGHPLRTLLTRDMRARLRLIGAYAEDGAAAPVVLKASASASAASAAAPADPAVAAWGAEGRAKWSRLGVPARGGGLLRAVAPAADDGSGEGGTEEEEEVDPATVGVAEVPNVVCILPGFEEGGKYTHWNQGRDVSGKYCYNYYTPEHAVCGCVATSMGAIMQYFRAEGCEAEARTPRNLIREKQDGVYGPSYGGLPIVEDWNKVTMAAILAGEFPYIEYCVTVGGPYDWSQFDGFDSLSAYSGMTDAHRKILGAVARDAGVGVAMQWSKGESSAYEPDVATAFTNLFGFADSRAVRNPRPEHYARLIYNQCRAGAPVALGISGTDENGSRAGHSVLAVGYGIDSLDTPRVRIFAGWGGAGDAWYALPYINTASVEGGADIQFDTIESVITMIGPENDETVPVVGRLTSGGEPIANAEIVLPGVIDKTITESGSYEDEEGNTVVEYATNTAYRVVTTDANGYFGTRVSPKTKIATLEYGGQQAKFAIGEDAKTSGDADALNGALPGAIDFRIMNVSTAYSFEEAIETALAENKAVLRVSASGAPGASAAVVDYITQLDKNNTDGFADRFVYFYSDYANTTSAEHDADPSVAVFLPQDASADERWYWSNGRLAYDFFNVVEDEETGVEYIVNSAQEKIELGDFGDEAAAFVTERVQAVLDGGYTAYLQRTSGISLVVTAYPAEAGTPDPDYGVYTDCFTNAQTVVATAPGLLTNETAGVVMECTGWTLADAEGATVAEGGSGDSFTLLAGNAYTLTWQVETNAVWISVTDQDSAGEGQTGGKWGATSPGSGWYPFGETVTFVATPSNNCQFSQWTRGISGRALPDYVNASKGVSVLSFEAEEPLDLYAWYARGVAAGMSTTNSVSMAAFVWDDAQDDFAETADANVPAAKFYGFAGADGLTLAAGGTEKAPAVSIALKLDDSQYVDASGVKWEVYGWIARGAAEGSNLRYDGEGDTAVFTPAEDVVVEWYWIPAGEEDDFDYDFAVEWADTLDNLASGNGNVLAAADELPDDFDLSKVNVTSVPTGWKLDGVELDDDGDLVAVLALDEEVLAPVASSASAAPITIYPGDGAENTYTVESAISNAAKGFWYSIQAAPEPSGAYSPVLSRQATADGELTVSVDGVDPGTDGDRRFYKLFVTEQAP